MTYTDFLLISGFSANIFFLIYLASYVKKILNQQNEADIQDIQDIKDNTEPLAASITNNLTKLIELQAQLTTQNTTQTTALQNLVTNTRFEELLDETRSFNRLIDNPQDAGSFGEDNLENFLQLSGIPEDHYDTQASYGEFRPDAEIFLPGNGKLLIDAKTPIQAWYASLNSEDEQEKLNLLDQNADSLKVMARELSTKGYHLIEGFNQPEFIVMYIPLDIIYLEFRKIAGNEFLDEANKGFLNTQGKRGVPIIFAPPALIGGVLRMVRLLWREKNSHEGNAELVSEIIKFADELKFLAKDLIDAGVSHHKSGNSMRKAFNRLSSTNTYINSLKGVMEAEDLEQLLETEFMSAPSNATDINADFIIDWISKNQSSLPEGFIEKLVEESRK